MAVTDIVVVTLQITCVSLDVEPHQSQVDTVTVVYFQTRLVLFRPDTAVG